MSAATFQNLLPYKALEKWQKNKHHYTNIRLRWSFLFWVKMPVLFQGNTPKTALKFEILLHILRHHQNPQDQSSKLFHKRLFIFTCPQVVSQKLDLAWKNRITLVFQNVTRMWFCKCLSGIDTIRSSHKQTKSESKIFPMDIWIIPAWI